MPEQLFSTHRVRRYKFRSSECLYRDFRGHRVVIDAEGQGEVQSIPLSASLTLVRDGLVAEEFPLVFRDTITGTVEGPGDVEAWLVFGPNVFDGSDQPISIVGDYEGAGWLSSPTEPVMIDESHEWLKEVPPSIAIPFSRSVRTTGRWQLRPANVRAELVDAWDIEDLRGLAERDWRVQNISKLRELDSFFPDGMRRSAQVSSHLNVAAWKIAIPLENEGVILRKFYDRFHGRQRARVRIDGVVVGVWYEPGEDRETRWAISEFGIPAEHTRGKSSLEIAIDPPSGTALWSVSRVETFALLPA